MPPPAKFTLLRGALRQVFMTQMVSDALASHLSELVTHPLDILVVDRSRDITEQFVALLNHFGHRAVSCFDAESAMLRVVQQPFDAVISGLKLPFMDGFAFAQLLRSHPHTSGACLIAVSGAAGTQIVEQSLRAGFDAHFCKPVRVEDILQVLPASLVVEKVA